LGGGGIPDVGGVQQHQPPIFRLSSPEGESLNIVGLQQHEPPIRREGFSMLLVCNGISLQNLGFLLGREGF
jgi:hypothetical protein